MSSLRRVFAYATLSTFCIFFFTAAINYRDLAWQPTLKGFPDFSQITFLRTVSAEEFASDDTFKRVIIVGDIHGMDKSLSSLLSKLSYEPTSDVLIHVGDIVTRGSLSGSLSILSFMSSNNITGVRGNNDQKVIEWRAWLHWIIQFPDGQRWLDDVQARWAAAEAEGVELDLWYKTEKKKHVKHKWWNKIPKGWVLFNDHYKVAEAMSTREYDYLLSLPLVLYVPSAHTFFVHAGLLPSDPRYPPDHHRQPLARIPALPAIRESGTDVLNATVPILRHLQELAVLREVPQNQDPWVPLNMRGVLPNNKITRKKNGQPWSEIWNRDMSLCNGFDGFQQEDMNIVQYRMKKSLPCHPSTVVYGHSASRGLDVKRWTIGLDTGCIYNRRLTALVLGPSNRNLSVGLQDSNDIDDGSENDNSDESPDSDIPYGDDGNGHLVSIECH